MTDISDNQADDQESSRHSSHISSSKSAQALDIKMQELKQSSVEYETEAQARAYGIGYVNLTKATITTNLLVLVSEDDARRLGVICFNYKSQEVIDLAVVDPQVDGLEEAIKALEKRYHVKVHTYLMSHESLQNGLKQYEHVTKVIEKQTGVEVHAEDLEKLSTSVSLNDIEKRLQEVSLTEIVTYLMAAAINNDVTDIHVEAEEHDVKLRFRIDGVLHTVATLERTMWKQIASRIKLLAHLKINIENKPQDGRVRIELKDENVDVRVSTLPTAFGESVAMRLLRTSMAVIDFDNLGIVGQAKERLEREVKRPSGMILTCGPTGAGKTTTMYSIITVLNTPETKIITIEDPIEYEMDGINQSQIDESKGYDFSSGLKSIVRQDPDVIMVGEMRDEDTVDVAINAALTGHLVLSSVHTRNAAGSVPRLLAMGAKAHLLAPSLNAVIAQRLVRKMCTKCAQEYTPTPEQLERITKAFEELPEGSKKDVDVNNLTFKQGAGCEACGNIGYKGRVGIFEVFIMSPELEQIILSKELSEYKIEDLLREQGMITMFQDGLLKALEGVTTVEEVFRITE